jgi:xanthine dehydrogenase YagT iron-sulfur-binding subunit
MLRYQLDSDRCQAGQWRWEQWSQHGVGGWQTRYGIDRPGHHLRWQEGENGREPRGDRPDPVPKAFAEYDASQCGFCTPGFVVAVRAFLDKNPDATEAEIRQGLNGNLCRCGTYANIVQAAVALVKGGSNG